MKVKSSVSTNSSLNELLFSEVSHRSASLCNKICTLPKKVYEYVCCQRNFIMLGSIVHKGIPIPLDQQISQITHSYIYEWSNRYRFAKRRAFAKEISKQLWFVLDKAVGSSYKRKLLVTSESQKIKTFMLTALCIISFGLPRLWSSN